MLIKKINTNDSLNVSIPEEDGIRLPHRDNNNETSFVNKNSYLYRSGYLNGAFFCMFDEGFEVYGNEFDSNIIDIIPVIDTLDEVEKGAVYLIKDLPFIAKDQHTLVCLSRLDFIKVPEMEFGEIDYDEVGEHIIDLFEDFLR